jgi:hypothetical protein
LGGRSGTTIAPKASWPPCRKWLIAQDCEILEKGGLRHPRGGQNALLEVRVEKS